MDTLGALERASYRLQHNYARTMARLTMAQDGDTALGLLDKAYRIACAQGKVNAKYMVQYRNRS